MDLDLRPHWGDSAPLVIAVYVREHRVDVDVTSTADPTAPCRFFDLSASREPTGDRVLYCRA